MAARSSRAELPGLVEHAPAELIAFRQTDYDMPFWARDNSFAARWNAAGDPPTQYWSLHPDGAWAEHLRQEEVVDEATAALVRRTIWTCRVPRGTFVDLRDPATCATHGIDAAALTAPDWGPCQALAARLRADGCPGVLSPCAALDGHTNLTIFGAKRAIDWQRRPALRSQVPAAVVAVGSPPVGLVRRVAEHPPRSARPTS
ncbi:RES family NAD+ phosphorylase [Patulibacter sp.]|uniref:RES family NAD+ phosphorylase n=1 Tax=Patulibacter sp. TaxID=1912859 RepID=UPI0027281D00|nr:RES family NAD+ phosphorylase [Patulibacter sp.]MDO9408164.1 RES family NAD+ phosphorylase [Patulibacter sp.]